MKVLLLCLSTFLLGRMNCSAQAVDSIGNLLKVEKTPSAKAYLYKELSYEFLIRQQLDSCLKYAMLGVTSAKEAHDKRAEAYNLEMVGNYYYYIAYYEKAMDVFSTTLKIGNEVKDSDLQARSYGMMGWIYLEQRRFDGAHKVFSNALLILNDGRGNSEDLALTYYGMASVYAYRHSSLRTLPLAIAYYDSALRVIPGLKKRERAFALTEMGAAIRDERKEYDLSLKIFQEAYELLHDDPNHRDAYAYLLSELALTHVNQNRWEKARKYALETIAIYEELPLATKIPSVYALLSDAFEKMNDFEMAFRMERENRTLSDSLFSRRNILLVEQIRAQYDEENRMKEIDRLSEANLMSSVEAKNNRNVAIVVSVASLTIFGLLILNYFNRNRYQRRIQTLKLQQSVREERDRIARDLHDSLGGQLSSISIGLSRVSEPSESALIQAVQTMADRALHELRDSLWVMNKEIISIENIEQRVNTLFWQYRKIETPMQFDLNVQQGLNALTIPSILGGNIYRIIQEATHNAVKHSEASLFQVMIESKQRHLTIVIQDNGTGFEVNTKESSEHFGLKNMKKRAKDIGAKIKISSAIGKGTLIEIELTLDRMPGAF